MKVRLKYLLFLFFLNPLIILGGCNSEYAFDGTKETLPVTPPVTPPVDATLIEITVTPSPVLVYEGRTQQLVAMAKYDDGTEKDVSDSATWEIVGDPTIATVSTSGLLTGDVKGDTELTASNNGITSNTVNITVCDLTGPCLDIFDTGSGKLFTNSPSVAYLDIIGGSAANAIYAESDPNGRFYLFNWNNANALCATYSTHSIGGRTNWRLATRDELKGELYDEFGNMLTARGWPIMFQYWSETPYPYAPSYYYILFFDTGYVGNTILDTQLYASCVSEP